MFLHIKYIHIQTIILSFKKNLENIEILFLYFYLYS